MLAKSSSRVRDEDEIAEIEYSRATVIASSEVSLYLSTVHTYILRKRLSPLRPEQVISDRKYEVEYFESSHVKSSTLGEADHTRAHGIKQNTVSNCLFIKTLYINN